MKDRLLESYTRLYEEAENQGETGRPSAEEELCPLYFSLQRIEERYGEGELIGKGGMKEILRVYDERTERFVALARPRAVVGTERYDSFLREAHITARLEHPNIIKVFDMGLDPLRRPFFTMEFKRGKSLRKILNSLRKGEGREDYPYEKRISILLRVCEAMAYAHSKRVLHLDLKPENIQVGTFGEVVVCDWGMGEIERDDDEETSSVALLDPDLYGDQLEQSVKGTPGYMAPEQGSPREPKTAATDVYALGCLLYELSTLRAPQKREGSPATSPGVEAIVSKACAEKPEKRYQSVEAMRQDVHRHLSGFSAEVENAGFLREVRLFYRRNQAACLISIFCAILVVGTAVFFTQKLRGSYNETAAALVRTEDALGAAEQARVRAEEALGRYEQEREFATALFEDRKDTPINNALFLVNHLMVDEDINLSVIENTILSMERSLSEDPSEDNRLWTLKAHVLFMIQEFSEAEKYYAIRVGDQGYLRRLIPEFEPKVRENGLLGVDDFILLLEKLSMDRVSRFPLMEKMMVYDSIKRDSPEDTAKVVEAMLRMNNPGWEEGEFVYDKRRKHLRVSGSGLTTLFRRGAWYSSKTVPARCLLRLLEIRSLDISGSGIADLRKLDGLNLDELDLRDTPATDLSPLATMLQLRMLKVDAGQFNDAQLAVLRGQVKVVVENQGSADGTAK